MCINTSTSMHDELLECRKQQRRVRAKSQWRHVDMQPVTVAGAYIPSHHCAAFFVNLTVVNDKPFALPLLWPVVVEHAQTYLVLLLCYYDNRRWCVLNCEPIGS